MDAFMTTDESVQLHGVVFIFDFGVYSIKDQTKIAIDERKQFVQSWQVTLVFGACSYCNT